jgi:hypothetical protein
MKLRISDFGFRIWIALLAVLLAGGRLANGQQIITATVTVTNVAGTTNGNTITVNANSRLFTNLVGSASQILTFTNITGAASNLFLAYAMVPEPKITLSKLSTNAVLFQSYPTNSLAVSISSGWGTLTLITNTITNAIVVRVPKSIMGPYERTNVVNGLVDEIGDNAASNKVHTNAPAFSEWFTFVWNGDGGGGGGGGGGGVGTNYVTPFGEQIYPVSQGTNFWWDMGRTNVYGPTVYFTIQATNDVNFLGITNSRQWGLLSVNVVASGANRLISLPNTLPHLNTNGLTLVGSRYTITLTNGNEFRFTAESNSTLSTIWATFGQSSSPFSFITNVPSATNSGNTGDVLTKSGNDARWWPALSITNNRQDGWQIFATGSTDGRWAPPVSGGSGGSPIVQSFYKYLGGGGEPVAPPFGASTQTIFWQLGNAQMLPLDGALGGSITFSDTGFSSSGSTNWETHTLTVLCIHSNVAVSYPSWWIFTTPAPNNIISNQIAVYHFAKVGSQTNILVNVENTTNNLALSLFQSQ